ncbi:MAG: ATP phosphoribosyltransferase [Deltaproteobacteria bacterium]|nr:MAG: ATP phosphoribosyltransferase [Deltaproteobacteria bacterium]
MKVLKLGIPKGSLERSTVELFRKAGWNITVSSRSFFPQIDDEEIRCTLARAQEMSRFVEMGTLDAGITGKDWILENGSRVVVVEDLIYSKTSQRPARWVLIVPEDSPVRRLEDLQGKKIFTELVNFTKGYFAQRGVEVEVEFSWGATEAKVLEGLADAVVDVTETGTTLRANGLRIVEELLVTYPQLIANEEAWQDPWKREKISAIAQLLKGALRAGGMVGLKMNVPKSRLPKIMEILPSITAPTVADLYGKDWVAVETVISEREVRDLVPRLLKEGAVGIIEYPLNKIL